MMSTNYIDSSNCEEKTGGDCLCGIAEVSEQADEVCASCGVAEVDNVKLKECTCELVKYCSDKCKEDHREQHDKECNKRMDELHDKILFTQPNSCCHGECPICFLPMPLDNQKSTFYSCCSKTICNGCDYVHHTRNKQNNCPFCREPTPDNEEYDRRIMKRVEADDPVAMVYLGLYLCGVGNYDGAVKYWKMAAKLGDVEAHFHLGVMYQRGRGVEKDEEKAVHYYEKAAIGGNPHARYNLGCYERRNGRFDRAVKHFIIAANLGQTDSMKELWDHYKLGNITKEDLEATLRTHQAAIDAMKSPQREAAQAFYGD